MIVVLVMVMIIKQENQYILTLIRQLHMKWAHEGTGVDSLTKLTGISYFSLSVISYFGHNSDADQLWLD